MIKMTLFKSVLQVMAALLIFVSCHTSNLPKNKEQYVTDSTAMAKNAPIARLSSMATGMQWIGKAVDDPDYYVWCTSPIMGDDKKVHLFCSRWPKKYKMDGWTTHSFAAVGVPS
jgi:hypothetical protein